MKKINLFFDKLNKKLNKTNHKYRQFYFIYTAVFIFVCMFLYGSLVLKGKTNIWYVDGFEQHYQAYVYNAKYWREFLKELFINHNFSLKEWEYALGEGGDILSTLHFYVIGDPFTIFTVLTPVKYMWICFMFLVLLRMYLAGVAFSYMCFYFNKNYARSAVLLGAISYVFCYWAYWCGLRHPMFIAPLIYLPLIVVGIEKILSDSKPYLYVCAVFLSAITNFYFFYVTVLVTVVYVAVRLLSRYKKDYKKIFISVLKIFLYSVVAVMLAMFILLPIITMYINDARVGNEKVFRVFYELKYYEALPGRLLGTADTRWTMIAMASPIYVATLLLLLKKGKGKILKIYYLIVCIALILPICGSAFNVFSYSTNRWTFVVALLSSYAFVYMWEDMCNIKKSTMKKLLVVVFIHGLYCMYSELLQSNLIIGQLLLVVICLIVLMLEDRKRVNQVMICAVLFVSIYYRDYYNNHYLMGDYLSELKDIDEIGDVEFKNEVTAVKMLMDKKDKNKGYRYTGKDLSCNAGLVNGLAGSTYYWSTSNPKISNYRDSLDVETMLTYYYHDYDDKASLLALNGMKYYVKPYGDEMDVPYGFKYVGTVDVNEKKTDEYIESVKKEMNTDNLSLIDVEKIYKDLRSLYDVYESDNVLPIAYAYDKVIDANEYDNMLSIDKQNSMLEAVKLDNYDGKIPELNYHIDSDWNSESVTINDSNYLQNVYIKDDSVTITKENTRIDFRVTGKENCETYLYVEGLSFKSKDEYDFYFNNENLEMKDIYSKAKWNMLSLAKRQEIRQEHHIADEVLRSNIKLKRGNNYENIMKIYTEEYPYYNGRDKYLVNLGYSKEPVKSFSLTFEKTGVYHFDNIKVCYQPMKSFESKIKELKSRRLKNISISDDMVKGDINLKQDAVLNFNIPYSKGWKAYVDNKCVKTYVSNEKNIAIDMPKGYHKVKLVYKTPFFREGCWTSIIMFMSIIIYTLIRFVIKRRMDKSDGKM